MYRSAAVCATEILAGNPDNVQVLELAAVSSENAGLREKALEYYEKLYLQTDDFNSLYKAAVLQMELERFVEANVNLDILLNAEAIKEAKINLPIVGGGTKEYPFKALLYNMKGMVEQALGNKEEARGQFRSSLELAPEFSTAKEYLDALDN